MRRRSHGWTTAFAHLGRRPTGTGCGTPFCSAWQSGARSYAGEPRVARVLLRRLIGPLVMIDDNKTPDHIRRTKWSGEPSGRGKL